MARPYREDWTSPEYVIDENIIVNDNAKLLRYLQGSRYVENAPASVRQYRPAGTYHDSANLPYVVWDDDRRADPLAGATSFSLGRELRRARASLSRGSSRPTMGLAGIGWNGGG